MSYYFKLCQIQNCRPEKKKKKKKMQLETTKGKDFENMSLVLNSPSYYTILHWPFLKQ